MSFFGGYWGSFEVGGVWMVRLLGSEDGGAELRCFIGDMGSCCSVDDGDTIDTPPLWSSGPLSHALPLPTRPRLHGSFVFWVVFTSRGQIGGGTKS